MKNRVTAIVILLFLSPNVWSDLISDINKKYYLELVSYMKDVKRKTINVPKSFMASKKIIVIEYSPKYGLGIDVNYDLLGTGKINAYMWDYNLDGKSDVIVYPDEDKKIKNPIDPMSKQIWDMSVNAAITYSGCCEVYLEGY